MHQRYRRLSLLAAALVALALLPLAANATTHGSSAPGVKIYTSSPKCGTPVVASQPSSWACTKITVPTQSVAGQKAKVIFEFTAKQKLTNVQICFAKINSRLCAYKPKYAVMKKGKVIKKTLYLLVPSSSRAGAYKVDNYSYFVASTTAVKGNPYWGANAFVVFTLPAA